MRTGPNRIIATSETNSTNTSSFPALLSELFFAVEPEILAPALVVLKVSGDFRFQTGKIPLHTYSWGRPNRSVPLSEPAKRRSRKPRRNDNGRGDNDHRFPEYRAESVGGAWKPEGTTMAEVIKKPGSLSNEQRRVF